MTRYRRGGGPGASPLRAVPQARRLADLDVVDSDALLASADEAVETVAAVLPARAGMAGAPVAPVDAAGLRSRHDGPRGVRFAALAAGAEELRTAAGRVRARHRALAEEAGTLYERWSGPSADEVADRVVSLGRATHEVVTLLEETAETVEAAGLAVADAVAERADAARALAADLPGPPSDPDPRAWAAVLDARLHRYLDAADRTDRTITAAWRDLAERIAALRRLSGDDAVADRPAGAGADALGPDLLALPEILAALGPLTAPEDAIPGDDATPDAADDAQTVDDSR